jgi:hypothetical protein
MNIFLKDADLSAPLFLRFYVVLLELKNQIVVLIKKPIKTTALTTNYNPMNIFLKDADLSAPLFLRFYTVLLELKKSDCRLDFKNQSRRPP